MSALLSQIYQKIYTNTFSYENFDCRKNLQKAIYLLENMGVNVGDYSFSWDNYGPYSLELDCEASQEIPIDALTYSFSELAESCFEKVKGIVSQHGTYTCTDWMECIASLHYLKNVLRYNDAIIIDELIKRKSYLFNSEENRRALDIANSISVEA